MKYQAGSRRRAKEYEKAILDFWAKDRTFEKSVESRGVDKSFVFYDGPPFITGQPHHGTLLASVVKDTVARFWTMRGYRVERKWGWDCHGLPAENFVEKQLGITDRRQIGAEGGISLENYILKAKESMVANSETWKGTIDRIGRWVDFDEPYRTMNKDFMESVWWAFKTLYEKGKIYEGRKVLMYDTRFGTPVSKAEVTMDNDAYKEVVDPSGFVLFKVSVGNARLQAIVPSSTRRPSLPSLRGSGASSIVADAPRRVPRGGAVVASGRSQNEHIASLADIEQPEEELYFLAWTTTPWTLPANKALAVNPKMEYGVYEVEGKRVVVAEKLAEKVLGEGVKSVETFKGSELEGVVYEDLLGRGERKVFCAEFVGDEEGTGIVHIAPAYGEDDYELYLKHQDEMEFEDVLDENGYYLPEVAELLHGLGVRDTDENGIEIWAGNKFIAKVLEEKGIVFKIEYIKHEYPFNPRSKQRIMYRAFPSWFFDIQGSKPLMLEKNEKVNWFPKHFKEGRFKKNIEAAPDWNLSRDRFFATAMPVWKGDKGTVKVVGSYEELYELSGVKLEDYHRPWVDQITFEIDGEKFRRIEKVLDCWFESGSMPFAQMHYPFENKEKFERNYPADFITEYVGQVRAWFYYVHAVNTALFGEEAFKNVIVTGTLAGNDGRKMSKSLGNFTDPNELMDKFSADSLRFLLLASPVTAGEDFALIDKDVSDVARKLSMVWNVYDFFCTYAEVDKFEHDEKYENKLENLLDKWIVSRASQLRDSIVEGAGEYNLPKAVAGVLPFIDDLSNWFVRRSRRRFWKSEDDGDKREAYETLYFVLVYLSEILAPFVPFLAEELYQKMTGAGESVHLLDFPEEVEGGADKKVLADMGRTREVISEGLQMRMRKSEMEEQIKVRQPLRKFVYPGEKLSEFYEEIIRDELNVKEVEAGEEYFLDKKISRELKEEGFVRELIRVIQSLRKKAGLSVDDRIKLMVTFEVPERFVETVKREVLAVEMGGEGNYRFDEVVEVEGEQGTISLEKI